MIFEKLDSADAAPGKTIKFSTKSEGISLSFLLHLNISKLIDYPEKVHVIPDAAAGLDPKVVAVYTKYVPRSLIRSSCHIFYPSIFYRIGVFLKSYRAGPIPKPFKVLPSLPAWARLLSLTSPPTWSPHATYAATRLLISGLKPAQARVYLEGVLLDAVRENIRDNGGKLNVHLYDALKRALYKPAAFFKGILFPLCEVSLVEFNRKSRSIAQ